VMSEGTCTRLCTRYMKCKQILMLSLITHHSSQFRRQVPRSRLLVQREYTYVSYRTRYLALSADRAREDQTEFAPLHDRWPVDRSPREGPGEYPGAPGRSATLYLWQGRQWRRWAGARPAGGCARPSPTR